MLLHVDNIAFKEKPSGAQIGGIKSRFTRPSSIRDITVKELADCLCAGITVQPGVTPFSENSKKQGKKGSAKEDFTEQTVFMNDIDNKRRDVPIETPAHVVEVLAAFGLKAAFMYETFNSTAENRRFRIAIVSKEKITDRTLRNRIQAAFIKAFPQSDPDCINEDRIFFGTYKGLIEGYTDFDAVCSLEALKTFADTFAPAEEKPKFGETIPSGQRHGTLVSFASTVLTKYGITEQAHDLYMQRVAQCEEPKPDSEVDKIWKDACKYYEQKIVSNPNYIPPEEYATKEFSDEDEDTLLLQTEIDAVLSSEITVDTALSPELLSLAAWAYQHDMTRYVKLKGLIPKSVGVRIFEKEVQKIVKGGDRKKPVQLLTLTGIPTQGMLVPGNWIVNDNGIYHMELVFGEPMPVLISSEPLFVSAKLVNVDDGTEKLEITYRRNGKYKTLIAPRSDVLNKNTIIRYADDGFPVSSGTAGAMTKYISEAEAVNAHVIPIRRAIRRAGWIENEFYPYSLKDGIAAQSDGNEAERILSALRKSGSEEVWMNTAAKVRAVPFARAMLAASLASPLLEKLGHRNIYVHIWYSSRSGKTAVLKFVMSAWGNPRILVSKYFSTLVGMERTAGTLKHLPFAMDELQTLDQRRISVNDVVYTLGNGVGKTRGRIGAGIQKVEEWHNCILSTGEQPMSADNSMDGVNTRLMEIYACPLSADGNGTPDDELAKELHHVSEMNYGFAGEKYIRRVISHMDRLQTDYIRFTEALKSRNVQRDNIAVLALADYYESLAVFDLPEEQAYAEAVALGELLLKNQEDNAPKDSVESAWEFVCGWIASNKSHFCGNRSSFEASPLFGKIEKNEVHIIASVLNGALEEASFSARKCIKGFQERKQIGTFTDAQGKTRSQTTDRIKGTPAKVYVLNLCVEDDDRAAVFGSPIQPLTADEPDFLK